MENNKQNDKELLKEVVGWLVKGLFNRSVKAAETFMKNDPRVRKAVVDAAKAMKKAEDDVHDALEDKYGGTPDEIADRARRMGMSVEKYTKYFLRKNPDGSRIRA
jgi:hypothetical protein